MCRCQDELDSGIFAIADAMSMAEARYPCLQQAGTAQMRLWLGFMTWLEGDIPVNIDNTVLTPTVVRNAQGVLPRSITRRS
eukprot:3314988-Rhodomonas_salina.1